MQGARMSGCTDLNGNSHVGIGMCLHALVLKKEYVPVRNSMLTRILGNILNQNSQIDLIVCMLEGIEK